MNRMMQYNNDKFNEISDKFDRFFDNQNQLFNDELQKLEFHKQADRLSDCNLMNYNTICY